MPSVAFGVSCALAELTDTCRKQPTTVRHRCVMAIRTIYPQTCRYARRESGEGQSGIVEAVRDGMVVNLLLEAIPDLHCVLTQIAPGHR